MTADGGEIKNGGEFDIVFRSPDGAMRRTTFQHAEVGLPIFSLNQVARDNHRVILDDDAGVIIHKPSGARFPFVVRNGVYFMQMKVPKALCLQQIGDTSFRRHGTA